MPSAAPISAPQSPPPAVSAAPPARVKVAYAASLLLLAGLAAWVFFYRLGAQPLTDWDEAWHAQVSAEIVSSGDWITLHYRGEPYFNKPPLTFWLRAIAFELGGISEAAARFWPALFAWGSIVAAAIFFSRILGRATGVMAGGILCTSWLFTMHHAGRSGETDSTLIFFLILTFAALWRARRAAVGFYLAAVFTGLGWMTKGSTAYVPWVAAAIAVSLERPRTGWRWRHFAGGLAVAVALTLPWQLTMLALHGRAFVRAFYIGEGAMPAVLAIENHPGDWRYYPMMLHALFEPWFLLAAAATGWVMWRYRRTKMPAAIWLIAWAAVVLGMCTLFATKMAWYTAPALPALAALAALAAVELTGRRFGWVVLAAVAAFAVYQLQIKHWPPLSVRLALAAAAVATVALIVAPAARARWQLPLAAGCALLPLGLHLRVMQAAVVYGKPMVDWMELRDDDEPWRELSERVARDFPSRRILLVQFPPDPACWFYFARHHAPGLIESCPLSQMSRRLYAGDPAAIIIREERLAGLGGMTLRERFRERALVVLTAD